MRKSQSAQVVADRMPAKRVRASVVYEIGKQIVGGDYPPGSILPNESQWSARFGVSRSVVREAIKMLMAKGLLRSRPKIGSSVEPRESWNLLDRDVLAWYAVAPDRKAFLTTVQEFRYIIEPEAAALAAQRRTQQQMTDIATALADMGSAQTLSERTEADTRFHAAILRASGNELLMPIGALIESALDHLFEFTTREVNDIHYAQTLHEDIERAIRAKQPEQARLAVRLLLANTDEVIRSAKHQR